VETAVPGLAGSDVEAQAFETPQGKRLLLLNKRGKAIELPLPADAASASARSVDEKSGEGPARSVKIEGGKITLDPYAVTVLSW
jgi:hypothetical protein